MDVQPALHSQSQSKHWKNWLNSASVSLSKLDQVKAKVYNVGLEIKAVASGKGNVSQGTSASGSRTTIQLDADPPLTNVMSQRTAWGSNTSIPDLIRQQSERQRPESASVSRRVRPPSGRRARPQSAKEPGVKGTGNGKPSFGIAVKGAKFDPASRPPKSTPHQNVTTGWVGPPAGIIFDPNVQEDNSVQKYVKRNGRQVAKLSMAYAGDLTEPYQPPAPTGSPDMIDMIRAAQGGGDGDFLSDDSFFSGDEKPVKMRPKSGGKPPRPTSGKKRGKQKKEKLLRRPTPEPIHFSLPTADMDESADLDTDRLIGSTDAGNASPLPFQSKPGFSYIHADISGHLLQDGRLLSEKVTPTSEVVRNGEIHADVEDDDFILNMIDDDDDGADTDDAGIRLEVESPKHNVQFDEANNITVSITPRNRGRPASASTAKSSKNYSGRSDLRYVKSRVDSGVSLSSVASASVKPPGSGFEPTGKSDSRPGSTTGRVRSLVSRQRSTGKIKIPTVAVAYSDDAASEGQRKTVPTATVEVGYSEVGQKKKEESESMKRAREGLITMVSQITEKESGGRWVEDPGTSPRKYVSEKERNYYTDAFGEKVEKKVTTKTLTLTGNDVSETKLIRTIDVQENRRREYQVPEENKPPKRTSVSQDHSRPTSAHKPSTSSENAANHIPHSHNDIGAGEKTTLTTSSTYRVKPRPISSQAVKTNREESKEDTGNRPKSASAASFTTVKDQPASSVTSAFVSKPNSRPESTNTGAVKDSIKVSDAFKAIRESGVPRTFNNDHVYASYTRAKSAPVKSKRKPAVEVEPVYIFTRKNEMDWDTPDVQECKDVHNRLKANGVNVAVDTLKRALLPPMDNSCYITPCDKPPLPNASSGLLSSPEVWLAAEFRRLKLANKAVERANERLFMQKQAEQKRAMAAMKDLKERPTSAPTTKKKKKPGKGKKKPKRVQSAGL
ncbi:uncharacterized protein LOC135501257 isoform X2 [Lineus longissimus]|uniref:uncharacterized protein LOC135501257 isoform X2 n=1 Tax=Lineus longissimus TaxID=88925 RepID=UPI002B4E740F